MFARIADDGVICTIQIAAICKYCCVDISLPFLYYSYYSKAALLRPFMLFLVGKVRYYYDMVAMNNNGTFKTAAA